MVDVNQNGDGQPLEGAEKAAFTEGEFEASAQQPKQVMITDVELRNIQRDLMDYKDKYLRLLADVENTRKRMQKERQELTKYAVENLIVEFLHPMDNLENALRFAQEMSDEVKHWALGFQMILTQFKDVLANNGVVAVDSVEAAFDPHIHEAVEIVETTNKPAGIVIEEYVRGYKMGDRTIRPARVKVTKSSQSGSAQENKPDVQNIENKNKS
jgi:molecular chaperone GrpE